MLKSQKQNKMILNTIAKLTNNFQTGFQESTLMGWIENYDEQGRLLTADPNYRVGHIFIKDIEYTFIRKGWLVKLYIGRQSYTVAMSGKKTPIETIDLKPDYVKEYENTLKSNN